MIDASVTQMSPGSQLLQGLGEKGIKPHQSHQMPNRLTKSVQIPGVLITSGPLQLPMISTLEGNLATFTVLQGKKVIHIKYFRTGGPL